MADKFKGKWLDPAPREHVCNLPWLTWGVKVGKRWQCQSPLGSDKRPCGIVWRVECAWPGGEKAWVPDELAPKSEPAAVPDGVRKLVTAEELDYWLIDRFGGVRLVGANWLDVARYLVDSYHVEKDT